MSNIILVIRDQPIDHHASNVGEISHVLCNNRHVNYDNVARRRKKAVTSLFLQRMNIYASRKNLLHREAIEEEKSRTKRQVTQTIWVDPGADLQSILLNKKLVS